jgi:hypothetical protein
VGDGTLIGNTQLQNHIYARIDEMFAGAGAYATLTLGGLFAVEGFGTHAFSAGGSGANILRVRNTSAGATNLAELQMGNDGSASAGRTGHTSSTYTTSAPYIQDALYVVGERTGGVSIAAVHASGIWRLYTGGTTERARVDASGNFLLGSTGSGTARRMNVIGAGATTISDAGNKGATLLISDTGGSSDNGGSIEFGAGYGSYTQPYFAAIKGYLTSGADNTQGVLTFHTRPVASDSGLTEIARLSAFGTFFLGDNANVNMTRGFCVNQAGADDEIICGKSSDIAHVMTTIAEADTYFALRKFSGTAGGVQLFGLCEGGTPGIAISGFVSNGDTAKTTSANGAAMVHGCLSDGAGGVTDLGTNENIMVVRNNGTTRFILDADGDSHQDVGTAWTNYDAHDDLALLNMLSAHITRQDDPLRASFGDWLQTQRESLETLKLVRFNEDGHHFLNTSRLLMLLTGAVRQLGAHLHGEMARRLDALEQQALHD